MARVQDNHGVSTRWNTTIRPGRHPLLASQLLGSQKPARMWECGRRPHSLHCGLRTAARRRLGKPYKLNLLVAALVVVLAVSGLGPPRLDRRLSIPLHSSRPSIADAAKPNPRARGASEAHLGPTRRPLAATCVLCPANQPDLRGMLQRQQLLLQPPASSRSSAGTHDEMRLDPCSRAWLQST